MRGGGHITFCLSKHDRFVTLSNIKVVEPGEKFGMRREKTEWVMLGRAVVPSTHFRRY